MHYLSSKHPLLPRQDVGPYGSKSIVNALTEEGIGSGWELSLRGSNPYTAGITISMRPKKYLIGL